MAGGRSRAKDSGMEAVVFCGIQACGKSTFYQRRFFDTHIRISLDMLRTRHRESVLLRACLEGKTPFVVDNTNPTAAERARYIVPAKNAGFRVVGYYFACPVILCLERNAIRPVPIRIPRVGLLDTRKRLQIPHRSEGFDALHYVRSEFGEFVVEDWREEPESLREPRAEGESG